MKFPKYFPMMYVVTIAWSTDNCEEDGQYVNLIGVFDSKEAAKVAGEEALKACAEDKYVFDDSGFQLDPIDLKHTKYKVTPVCVGKNYTYNKKFLGGYAE